MRDIPISELRKFLIIIGEWHKASPQSLKIAKHLEEEYGGNISIGRHPEIGFFVLHDQYGKIDLVWSENISS